MSDIVERLREYSKDWRDRASDESVAVDAADEIARLRVERYQLALAICGGEDAPGYLDSVSVDAIVDVARTNHQSHRNDIDRLMAAEATCEKLAKALEAAFEVLTAEDGCDLYPIIGSDNPNEHATGLVAGALADYRSGGADAYQG